MKSLAAATSLMRRGLPLSHVLQDRSVSLDASQASTCNILQQVPFEGKIAIYKQREPPGPHPSYNFQLQ